MPQGPIWPESHAEQTDILPIISQLSQDQALVARDDATHDAVTHNADPGELEAVNDFSQNTATQEFPTVVLSRSEASPAGFTDENHQQDSQQNMPEPAFGQDAGEGKPAQETPVDSENPGNSGETGEKSRHPLSRAGLISGAILGLLILLYGIDVLINQGNVPRGVTVAGVDIGGMDRAAAEKQLHQQLEPKLSQPVHVKAGDVTDSFNPIATGLSLNWQSTLDKVGRQPLNPITRLTSLFTKHEIGVVSNVDNTKLAATVQDLRAKVDRKAIEGTINFTNTKPVGVLPQQGQRLETQGATQIMVTDWAMGKTLALPVAIDQVKTTPEAVRATLEQLAKPAVSAPVTIHGENKDAKLDTKTIAAALTFEPGAGGTLAPKIDQEKIVKTVGEQLKSTEKEGKNAQISFSGNQPTVEPSVDGKTIDWEPTLVPLVDVLKKSDKRELDARYSMKPAQVTTEQANELGIKEVIGEFSTGGFAADSGTNIKVVANKVAGTIVKPGETFSLNEFTGPRGAPQGYVEAGVIENGAPAREVGGGISQFATTLYNASYFAGLKDAGHKEHSYYISRYPAAREATVFQGPAGNSLIDLKFTNDGATGVAIQTIWTPSQITVKLWGTKKYKVESVPGERTLPTDPQPKQGPVENCHASNGAPGFTASDTRILRDVNTGREIRRDTRTVRYNPQPQILCATPPPAS